MKLIDLLEKYKNNELPEDLENFEIDYQEKPFEMEVERQRLKEIFERFNNIFYDYLSKYGIYIGGRGEKFILGVNNVIYHYDYENSIFEECIKDQLSFIVLYFISENQYDGFEDLDVLMGDIYSYFEGTRTTDEVTSIIKSFEVLIKSFKVNLIK